MTEQWQELKETIIEMRDNDGTGTQQDVCKFLANLMDLLEKQISNSEKPNKWIPVSEKLPEDGRPVLIYAWNVHHVVARYDNFRTENGYKKCWVTADAWNGNTEIKHDVIAWMPLPPCYEPQESEESDAFSD